jgi:diguanylate cyclase (GGDEF)-like protein/PAS domain S-box-containing protein
VQSGADVIAMLDTNGVVNYVSPSHERVTGFPPDEVIGRTGLGRIHPDDLPSMEQAFADLLAQPDTTLRVEVRIVHRDGSWRTLEATAANMLAHPAVGGLVVNARDITDRKALEEQLVKQAFRDPLTGLANRALFLDRLEHATERAHRAGESLAVLFIDLDDFKIINDSLGHEAGDDLLKSIAARLPTCVRASDTVARLGGDEFTILLEGIESLDEPRTIAERIAQMLAEPISLGDREIGTQASVGIAHQAAETVPHSELLRRADVAMHAAKRSGNGRHATYQTRMDETVRHRIDFELEMRQALANDKLVLHYQPIIDLATGVVAEVEALVRWKHPKRGLLLPGAFIPFAEETGLIAAVGKWVLRTACEQWQAWHDEDPERRLPVIGVNLSGRQIQQPGIVSEAAEILIATGFPAEHLKLEITESVALEETEETTARLEGLRALGIQLAVDDFGTGCAGLRSLRHCPVDTLQIDRHSVSALGHEANGDTGVRAVLEFAHQLGLSATAEGVETAEQAAILRSLGCERGQGILFGRPGPFETIQQLIDRQASVGAQADQKAAVMHELIES